MTEEKKIIVHLNTVWRDRADFIVMARFEDGRGGRFEQLWTRRLGENRFEICCIPFFVYDLDLGDHVEAASQEDIQYLIQKVVWKSGHYTFRVWFGETTDPGSSERLMTRLEEMGCLWEWYSQRLVGIDAPSEQKVQEVAQYLAEESELGHLVYETGRSE